MSTPDSEAEFITTSVLKMPGRDDHLTGQKP
jgi:hypothetical protein